MEDLLNTSQEPNSKLSDSVPSTNYEALVAENQRILKEAEGIGPGRKNFLSISLKNKFDFGSFHS